MKSECKTSSCGCRIWNERHVIEWGGGNKKKKKKKHLWGLLLADTPARPNVRFLPLVEVYLRCKQASAWINWFEERRGDRTHWRNSDWEVKNSRARRLFFFFNERKLVISSCRTRAHSMSAECAVPSCHASLICWRIWKCFPPLRVDENKCERPYHHKTTKKIEQEETSDRKNQKPFDFSA